ncbi:MAG: hypothetical protein FJ030_02290 [Chloroflexi bacterium]|nr:hypothetical protein [Chloroflexota bacterium]
MPGFTPGRRWQPAYLPFHDEPLLDRVIETIELAVKGPLWGCRMCGNCLLQETAFICPMECPKDYATAPVAAPLPNTVTWTKRARASGTKSTNAQKSWGAKID